MKFTSALLLPVTLNKTYSPEQNKPHNPVCLNERNVGEYAGA